MEDEAQAVPRLRPHPRMRARTQSFFEFDAPERGTLTLTLSNHDPRDALFLGPDGVPRYRVATRIVSASSVSSSTIKAPFYSNSILSKSSPAVNQFHTERKHRNALEKLGLGTTCEVTSIYRIRKPSSGSGLQRTATANGQALGRGRSSSTSSSRQSSKRAPSSSGHGPPLSPINEGEDQYASDHEDDDEKEIFVAAIERRPFSFSPVMLHFNGKSGAAGEYLRRGKLFSSTRVFRSLTGEELRWKLSTPTPKLYDGQNNKLATYLRPFLPSTYHKSSSTSSGSPVVHGGLLPKTAVLEVTGAGAGVESDRVLDEIIVTLLLTFFL